jgi:hypothetical protein
MVTNRKIDPFSPSPIHMPSHSEAPVETFVGVLRRRRHEDREQLRAERLARWNELGRRLEASGWFHLEAAMEPAHAMLDHATHPRFASTYEGEGNAALSEDEAEQIAVNFTTACDVIIAAGGQSQLWHILVTDRGMCTHETVVHLSCEKLDEADVDEMAKLLDAAQCYALAAVAAFTSSGERQDARSLFGEECGAETLDRFAPFAVDNRVDDREDRVREAAWRFASARTNQDLIEASYDYAVGAEAVSERYDMRPIQRMGLIAWLARRIELQTNGGVQ